MERCCEYLLTTIVHMTHRCCIKPSSFIFLLNWCDTLHWVFFVLFFFLDKMDSKSLHGWTWHFPWVVSFLTFHERGLHSRSRVSVFKTIIRFITAHFLLKPCCREATLSCCQSSPFLQLSLSKATSPDSWQLRNLESSALSNSGPSSLSQQIHKQAPPLEDIAEDCSLTMRLFLKRALERNPSRRSSASELLKDEAINPPREDQPRCWSLDSALEEVTLTLLRQQSENHSATRGTQLPTVGLVITGSFLFKRVPLPVAAESSLCSEDSGHIRRKGSLYIDLGALSLVTGPPSSEYG